ncbi:phosphodiester glycosidase family protein [Alicyclobacillus tolerans]|uniref:phosphodiester glycosidase family protein n=1 Tax=Alicyclobacillus tolerans TaxID=90970 RepID=UPI001F47EFDF|nr:phosphodiester glycosidase family protein [Alicyclobacillus tolerans]MCF8565814.1 phosphodiester glycosidase family protein [Alicyclobacillus tolerans]
MKKRHRRKKSRKRLIPIFVVSAVYVTLLGTAIHHFLPKPPPPKTVVKTLPPRENYVDTAFETPIPLSVSDDTHTSGILVKTEEYPGFTATVMEIRNPSRVQVAMTKYKGSVGETVSQFVNDNNAVAGINGGSFMDPYDWRGTGGFPNDIVIANGNLINHSHLGPQPMIGFTASGQMIAGNYSYDQLKNMDVTQALSFYPVLVQHGQDIVQGNGGWGYAPRTVIGQKANGTVLLIVTNGRYENGPGNVGASLQDMANVLLQNGAVIGANLDGGSSATMILNGKLINEPTDVLGERKVATAIIVK